MMATTKESPRAAGFKTAVAPPRDEPLRDWVQEHVYLPNSPEGARYSVDAVPAHGPIWDAFEDSAVREISVVACVGFGKTAIFEGLNTFIVAEEPGDTLHTGQTDQTAQDWMESRMRKVWQMSPATREFIPTGGERSNWKKDSVIFRHMNFFAGAANVTSLQEKSMRYTFGDEVWRWAPGMIGYLLKRHHGRWNRKNLMQSQGGTDGGEWHRHAKEGQWFDFEHLCPTCGEGHVFDWQNFKYEVTRDGNEEFDWVAIFETVRLKCPHCAEEFEDTEYNRRQWAKCRPLWNGARHMPGRMTFRATFMTVYRYEWRDIVKEWILANEDKRSGQLEKLEQIINQRFADFWKPPSDTPLLAEYGDPYFKRVYHDGQKWEMELDRLLTIDCQLGYFKAVARAWGAGSASRLLWEGRLETWDSIKMLQDRLGIENRRVFIDARYRPEDAAKHARLAMRSDDMREWNLLMGEGAEGYPFFEKRSGKEVKILRIFSEYTRQKASDGSEYKFIRFSNLRAKDRLSALMASGSFGVPVDVSKAYHAEMQSEQKKEFSPGKWRWEKLKSHTANHFWDCEVEQIVGACLSGLIDAKIATTEE